MTMLMMDDVIKKYGQRVFGPFCIQIRSAECIAILGPNGAGKSTLLKLLSGTTSLTAGQIRFKDRSLSSWSLDKLSHHRAVLSQSQEMTFALSVRIVISLGRISRGRSSGCGSIVSRAGELLGVTHLMDRTVDTLSGGERARVHLARICAQLWDVEDGYILMDEPIAAIDPGLQDLLLETVMRFARMRRHAVVAVMHDLNHALRYFSRLILVHPGRALESVESGVQAKQSLEHLYGVRLSCLTDEQGDILMFPLRNK